MTKFPAVILCLGLAACSTAQVQQACGDAQELLAHESIAPLEIRAGLALLRTGAIVCGSPQYAELRERVATWLRNRK